MADGQIRAALAAMTAIVAAAGLAACGSSSAPKTSAPPATTSTQAAATTSTTVAASSAAANEQPALTKPGTTLKVGQTATVVFSTTLKNGSDGPAYPFKLTIESITPGSMADFKDISLTGVPKGSSPTYVKLRIVNVGRRALATSVGDPTYSVGAINGNDVDGDLSLTGYFPRCPQADSPSRFVPGQSFSTCQIFMEKGKVTQVGYDGSESTVDTPIIWAAQ